MEEINYEAEYLADLKRTLEFPDDPWALLSDAMEANPSPVTRAKFRLHLPVLPQKPQRNNTVFFTRESQEAKYCVHCGTGPECFMCGRGIKHAA